jgi:RsiW-degrading membrane proteinase PrsW (M82 family)
MRKLLYAIFIILFLLQLGAFFIDLELTIAIVTSCYMPVCFIFFFRRIDIFEKETWQDIISVFLLSCVTLMIYVFFIPFVHSLFETLSNDENTSFVDMLFGVAIPEEIIKIIPVLIILKFTKFINEPIDYIIYSSISALGFAFIENIQYIYLHQEDNLNIIAVRSFFPTLMHMCTTSIIGFQLYKFYKNKQDPTIKLYELFYITLPLIIAALLHTIYNLEEGLLTLMFLSLYYSHSIKRTLKESPFMDREQIKKELNTENSVTNKGNFKILILMTIGVLIMDLFFGYIHHGSINYDMFQNLQFILIIFGTITAAALDKEDLDAIWNDLGK